MTTSTDNTWYRVIWDDESGMRHVRWYNDEDEAQWFANSKPRACVYVTNGFK